MLYRIGHKDEAFTCGCSFPKRVRTEIYTGLMILDETYGPDRDWEQEGGYSILAETEDDVAAMKAYIDFDTHPPEWTTILGKSGYISCLFIVNNDFSIMAYMPKEITPQAILKELGEEQ